MESEKKGSRTRVDQKRRRRRKKKKKEWDGEKRDVRSFSFFSLFRFLFSLLPVSTPFLRFPPLSALFRSRNIPFERLVPQCILRTHVSLMGEIQFAFFHPREMENRCSKHVAGPRNNAKTEDIIRYLLYFVPIFVHANFDFSHHLEFVNLEFIESKDLIRRKFLQINTNMSLIFV